MIEMARNRTDKIDSFSLKWENNKNNNSNMKNLVLTNQVQKLIKSHLLNIEGGIKLNLT